MLQPFIKYFDISGRASRMEYWLFILFCMLILLVLFYIDSSLISVILFCLAIIIPSVTVGIRRYHDSGRSTNLYLLLALFSPLVLVVSVKTLFILSAMLVPANSIVVLVLISIFAFFHLSVAGFVFLLLKGTKGPNNYGSDPWYQATSYDV